MRGPVQSEASPPYLVISGHDYRSTRQATIHFLTRELARIGPTRFASIGFSRVSLIKHDPRAELWSRANIVEQHCGVECYLWRSLVHPVNLRLAALSPLEVMAFQVYARFLPRVLRAWIAEAGTVLVETGLSLALVARIKRINPAARLIYLCSDALQTIGCAQFLRRELHRVAPLFDVRRVASLELAREFQDGCEITYIPQAMDPIADDSAVPSPYAGGINLISIGSMLFDAGFFRLAASQFPECTFHVIGAGRKAASLAGPNLRVYGEMPHAQIIAHIRHADVGIAPYDPRHVATYLADTSMKLFQFGVYGLPAACPQSVVGQHPGRFGYIPGDLNSIVAALRAAIAHGRFTGLRPQSWATFAQRLLNPVRQKHESNFPP